MNYCDKIESKELIIDASKKDYISNVLDLPINKITYMKDDAQRVLIFPDCSKIESLLIDKDEILMQPELCCSCYGKDFCTKCSPFFLENVREINTLLLLAFKQHIKETRTYWENLVTQNWETKVNSLYDKITLLTTKTNDLQNENNELFDTCTSLQVQINQLKKK